jgi:hypothetical protein
LFNVQHLVLSLMGKGTKIPYSIPFCPYFFHRLYCFCSWNAHCSMVEVNSLWYLHWFVLIIERSMKDCLDITVLTRPSVHQGVTRYAVYPGVHQFIRSLDTGSQRCSSEFTSSDWWSRHTLGMVRVTRTQQERTPGWRHVTTTLKATKKRRVQIGNAMKQTGLALHWTSL